MLLRPLGLGLRARVRKRKEKGKQVCGLKETSKMSQESKAEPELEFEPNQMGYKLYNQTYDRTIQYMSTHSRQ